ncbi:MAG: MFS transporter [Anaerolineae bacterium]|nr:MAG: MFS transporter [Anaerolineae bacterium]
MRNTKRYNYLAINLFWLGLNVASGSITPFILPYMVALFAPPELKNTYLAQVRVAGLAMAMFTQPLAGLFSDRSTSRWGRRRPFIAAGVALDMPFLLMMALATNYPTLLLAGVLLQFSSNIAHGALQGLIPDLVPEEERGRVSGVKSLMELLPLIGLIPVAGMVDRGNVVAAFAIVAASLVVTAGITILAVREEPLQEKPADPLGPAAMRILLLTVIFVAVMQGSQQVVDLVGQLLAGRGTVQWVAVGLAGLAAMAGSIILGVYFSAWVGIGRGARQHASFIWWVVNRLLFLAAVGSIPSFALYYLRDVLLIENAATVITILMAIITVFLLAVAIISGYLADGVVPTPSGTGLRRRLTAFLARLVRATRLHTLGRRGFLVVAGIVAAIGTGIMLISPNIPVLLIGGCVIGVGVGMFWSINWALGTELAPPEEAGKYLGISNLAGAGAGIVGAGIGGPMADFFNLAHPGLGYVVIFAIYGALFLLSSAVMRGVKE